MQWLAEYALGMFVLKECPQGSNDVLQTKTAVGPSPVAQETLNLV